MSLRSVVLKRPLRARSLLTSCATSNDAAAASGELNGTIAMGIASACPLVTSTVRSAQLCRQNSSRASRPKHDNCLFIWLEPNDDVSIEQGRIRRLRQGRCTIHRIFYRLAHRRVAVALRDMRAAHLPARDLRELDLTIEAHAGRRRLDPRSLDSIANSRDIGVARRAGFDGAAMFLVGQLLA